MTYYSHPPRWLPAAKALRAEGYSYANIAYLLTPQYPEGVSEHKVKYWLVPDRRAKRLVQMKIYRSKTCQHQHA